MYMNTLFNRYQLDKNTEIYIAYDPINNMVKIIL